MDEAFIFTPDAPHRSRRKGIVTPALPASLCEVRGSFLHCSTMMLLFPDLGSQEPRTTSLDTADRPKKGI